MGGTATTAAPAVVTLVSKGWLGVFGGILAMLGVVAAPITSGDTAFRSARLILSDFLHVKQEKMGNRLAIAIPLFAVSALLLWFNIADENGFNTIWRYFGWANQTLSVFMFWTATAFLAGRGGISYLITLIPGVFMTAVCVTFILVDKTGFGLNTALAPWIGCCTAVVALVVFFLFKKKAQTLSA